MKNPPHDFVTLAASVFTTVTESVPKMSVPHENKRFYGTTIEAVICIDKSEILLHLTKYGAGEDKMHHARLGIHLKNGSKTDFLFSLNTCWEKKAGEEDFRHVVIIHFHQGYPEQSVQYKACIAMREKINALLPPEHQIEHPLAVSGAKVA